MQGLVLVLPLRAYIYILWIVPPGHAALYIDLELHFKRRANFTLNREEIFIALLTDARGVLSSNASDPRWVHDTAPYRCPRYPSIIHS